MQGSDTLPKTADVVIIGAGMLGLCCACSLTKKGIRSIVILDRATIICGEASGANAGGLWFGHECLTLGVPGIAQRARESHQRLQEEFDCDFKAGGVLELIPDSEQAYVPHRLEQTRQAGMEASLVQASELPGIEPMLAYDGSALYFPQDGTIHPLKLAVALTQYLRENGVRFCLQTNVQRLEQDSIRVTSNQGSIEAPTLILTAGAWTPLLTALLHWEPPIRPIRGTLLASASLPDNTLKTVVIDSKYYYWQLACGPLGAGGSLEDVGFEEEVDDKIAASIRSDFQKRFPALSNTGFDCRWSGFRPYCEDSYPVIGKIPRQENIYVAAGHFRRGVMLAPLTGEMLASEIQGDRDWEPIMAFRPERFPVLSEPC